MILSNLYRHEIESHISITVFQLNYFDKKLKKREKDKMELHMMQQNQMSSLMQREQYLGSAHVTHQPMYNNESMRCKFPLACFQQQETHNLF